MWSGGGGLINYSKHQGSSSGEADSLTSHLTPHYNDEESAGVLPSATWPLLWLSQVIMERVSFSRLSRLKLALLSKAGYRYFHHITGY